VSWMASKASGVVLRTIEMRSSASSVLEVEKKAARDTVTMSTGSQRSGA